MHIKLPSNPFSAGRRIDNPRSFAGRLASINEACDNVAERRHLFVLGERGVGKTSFATQLRLIMQGDEVARAHFEIAASFPDWLPVYISCDGSEDLPRLVQRCARRLLHAIDEKRLHHDTQRKLKIGVGWLDVEWGETKTSREKFSSHVVDEFADLIRDLYDSSPQLRQRRIAFFLDEIDLVLESNSMGKSLKSLIETLHEASLNSVQFVLIGIQDSFESLLQQHPSLQRFFIPIALPLLSRLESIQLCNLALSQQGPCLIADFGGMDAPAIISYAKQILADHEELFTGKQVPESFSELLTHFPGMTVGDATKAACDVLAEVRGAMAIKFQAEVVHRIADLAHGHPHAAHFIGGKLFESALSELTNTAGKLDGGTVRTREGYRLLPAPKVECALVDLEVVVRKIAHAFRSKEVTAMRRVLKEPNAELVLSVAASFENPTFGAQQIQNAASLKKKETAGILAALVAGKIFRHSLAEMYEFHEPLLRFNIRLLQESDRLRALADRARRANLALANDGTTAEIAAVAKRREPTPEELDEQRALHAENMLHAYLDRVGEHRAKPNTSGL